MRRTGRHFSGDRVNGIETPLGRAPARYWRCRKLVTSPARENSKWATSMRLDRGGRTRRAEQHGSSIRLWELIYFVRLLLPAWRRSLPATLRSPLVDFFEPSSLPAFFATALLVCAGRLLACRRSLAETLLASLGSLLARSSFPASLATRRLVFACIIEPVVAADFRAAIPKPL